MPNEKLLTNSFPMSVRLPTFPNKRLLPLQFVYCFTDDSFVNCPVLRIRTSPKGQVASCYRHRATEHSARLIPGCNGAGRHSLIRET